MLKHFSWQGICGILFFVAPSLQAEVFQVFQRDGQFSASEIEARVGDTIQFTNQDPHKHNVFSLSSANMFDLGELGQGEQRELVLKREGMIEVTCGIHGRAKLMIMVKQKLDHNSSNEIIQ